MFSIEERDVTGGPTSKIHKGKGYSRGAGKYREMERLLPGQGKAGLLGILALLLLGSYGPL